MGPNLALHSNGYGHEAIRERLSWRDMRVSMLAGLVALLVVGGLLYLFDGVSSDARSVVLDGLSNSIFWLAAALIGACATISALMLTTISLMEHLDTRHLGPRFLFHLRMTMLAALATIALAILALLLTIFPSAETEQFAPAEWQITATFYAMLVLTALMVGGFTIVLASLYSTVEDVFRNLPQQWVAEVLQDADADELEEECGEAGVKRAEEARPVGVGANGNAAGRRAADLRKRPQNG